MVSSGRKPRPGAAYESFTRPRSAATLGALQASRSMPRILMIDDATLFRMLEESFLRRVGCTIVRAAHEAELLGKARAGAPDVILLDTEYPGFDAPSCIAALKDDPSLRSIPVLVIAVETRAPSCGAADATLPRPVSQGALEMALCSLGRVSHRQGSRRGARVPAQIASPQGESRGVVKDISCSGLFVALPRPLPLDAPVRLSLHLPGPDGRRRVEARGVVVRQVDDEPDSYLIPGVGVRFVGIDPLTESIIDHYVGGAAAGQVDDDIRSAGDE